MQETNFICFPMLMLLLELLLECLFNFVEKYMKQLVFRFIWRNLFRQGKQKRCTAEKRGFIAYFRMIKRIPQNISIFCLCE